MANDNLRDFLDAIDAGLIQHAAPGETLDFYLLGRSALILGYELTLMTKDVDVVEIHGSRLLGIAVEIFGKDSPKRLANDFYLETVSSGLPPLPAGYQKRCVDVLGVWRVIRPKYPEPHDLIATKLRRFHAGDRDDIRILCDTGKVDSATLQERFDSAHNFSDSDDPRVVSSSRNLRAVLNYLEGSTRKLS